MWQKTLRLLSISCCSFVLLISTVHAQQFHLSGSDGPGVLALYVRGDGSPRTVTLTFESETSAAMVRGFDSKDELNTYVYHSNDDRTSPISIPIDESGVSVLRVNSRDATTVSIGGLPQDWGVSFQNGLFHQPSGWEEPYYFPIDGSSQLSSLDIQRRDTNGNVRSDWQSSEVDGLGVLRLSSGLDNESTAWKFTASGIPLILSPSNSMALGIGSDQNQPLITFRGPEFSEADKPTLTRVAHRFQEEIARDGGLIERILCLRRENAPTTCEADANAGGKLVSLVGESGVLSETLRSSLDNPVYQERWTADPLRSRFAFHNQGILGSVLQSLGHQNVTPGSHWGGAILPGFDESGSRERWDTLENIVTREAGVSPFNDASAVKLAVWANSDLSTNPFSQDQRDQLMWRAAASALRDTMFIDEDETLRGIPESDHSAYPGFAAFTLGFKLMPAYAAIAPNLPDFGQLDDEVHRAWTDGLRRVIDRSFVDNMLTTRNQSAHYLYAHAAFAEGIGDVQGLGYGKLPDGVGEAVDYVDRALDWTHRWVDSQAGAGYFGESFGPDASYAGITHYYMAEAYRTADRISRFLEATECPIEVEEIQCNTRGDQMMELLSDSLFKSYEFYNHTAAPEPNEGGMVAGFNYNHRDPRSFVNEQYGGARVLMDDVLAESALWRDEYVSLFKGDVLETLKSMSDPAFVGPSLDKNNPIEVPRFAVDIDKPLVAELPVVADGNFTRSFANELFAVRRPGYFTSIYIGNPAPPVPDDRDFYLPQKSHYQQQFYEEDLEGGALPGKDENSSPPTTPYVGGGMSLFWTPNYGTSITAASLTPLMHHGLVADVEVTRNDNTEAETVSERRWEDYFAVSLANPEDFECPLNEVPCEKTKNEIIQLEVDGVVEDLPIKYRRTYTFNPYSMRIDLRLETSAVTPGENITLTRFIENIPILRGDIKARGVRVGIPSSNACGENIPANSVPLDECAITDRAVVVDSDGEGIAIRFDKPHELFFENEGAEVGTSQFGRIEVSLDRDWSGEHRQDISYTISPILAGDINLDRVVDFADFLVLSHHYNDESKSGNFWNGDFDLNNAIEFQDFLILSSNYGSSLEESVQSNAPEPGMHLVHLALLVCLARTKVRRNSNPSV